MKLQTTTILKPNLWSANRGQCKDFRFSVFTYCLYIIFHESSEVVFLMK